MFIKKIMEEDVVGREVAHIYDLQSRGKVAGVVSKDAKTNAVLLVSVDFTKPKMKAGHVCLLDELVPLGADGRPVDDRPRETMTA
jgi:hypothetical protein